MTVPGPGNQHPQQQAIGGSNVPAPSSGAPTGYGASGVPAGYEAGSAPGVPAGYTGGNAPGSPGQPGDAMAAFTSGGSGGATPGGAMPDPGKLGGIVVGVVLAIIGILTVVFSIVDTTSEGLGLYRDLVSKLSDDVADKYLDALGVFGPTTLTILLVVILVGGVIVLAASGLWSMAGFQRKPGIKRIGPFVAIAGGVVLLVTSIILKTGDSGTIKQLDPDTATKVNQAALEVIKEHGIDASTASHQLASSFDSSTLYLIFAIAVLVVGVVGLLPGTRTAMGTDPKYQGPNAGQQSVGAGQPGGFGQPQGGFGQQGGGFGQQGGGFGHQPPPQQGGWQPPYQG